MPSATRKSRRAAQWNCVLRWQLSRLGTRLGILAAIVLAPILILGVTPPESGQDTIEVKAIGADVFIRFDAWLEKFLADERNQADREFMNLGERLAQLRRGVLAEWICSSPEAALAQAIPEQKSRRLPARIQQHLEEQLSVTGSFDVVASTRLDGTQRSCRFHRVVRSSDRRLRAFVYGRRLRVTSKDAIPIHGIVLDENIAVDESPIRLLPSTETSARTMSLRLESDKDTTVPKKESGTIRVHVGDGTMQLSDTEELEAARSRLVTREADLAPNSGNSTGTWTKGLKTFLLMRVSCPDALEESVSTVDARALMDQVSEFILANSYGAASLQVTVTDLLMLPYSLNRYSGLSDPGTLLATILQDARAAAQDAGYDVDAFDLDGVLASPSVAPTNCARVGNRGLVLRDSDANTACHEIGHNFGLWHANAWLTSDGSILGEGSNVEYANPFDTMGLGVMEHFNACSKFALGWLPHTAVMNSKKDGIFRLQPIDTPHLTPDATLALRLEKDGHDYWVETRLSSAARGLIINWSPWGMSGGGTHLLDSTPDSEAGFFDAPFSDNRSLYDHDLGLRVLPVASPTLQQGTTDVLIQHVHFVPMEAEQSLEIESSEVLPDASASGGQFVLLPAIVEGARSVSINIPMEGEYAVWCRILSNLPQSPLLAISIDDEWEYGQLNWRGATDSWQWAPLVSPETFASPATAARRFHFTKGMHTVRFAGIDDAIPWDAALFTNDPTTDIPALVLPMGDQTIVTGAELARVPFTLLDCDFENTPSPILTALSSNSRFVAASGLSFEGSGANRTLLITPKRVQPGKTYITIQSVKANGTSSSTTFGCSIIGKIQALVDGAAAGATINIPPETYLERLTLNRDVTLEGGGPGAVITSGGPAFALPLITISTNTRVTLRRLTLRQGACAVRNYGQLLMEDCSITEQHGWDAVFFNGKWGTATMRNCSIYRNSSEGDGGCIRNNGELKMLNCTVSQNHSSEEDAFTEGGGILNNGHIRLDHCTVVQNRASAGGGLANHGEAFLANCILAENRAVTGTGPDLFGTITSGGHNLIQRLQGCRLDGDLTGNIYNQTPRLNPLAHNGGAVLTHAPRPDSPALDAASAGSLATDSAGAARCYDVTGIPNTGDGADIGAVEFVPGARAVLSVGSDPESKPLLFLTSGAGWHWQIQASVDLESWTPLIQVGAVIGRHYFKDSDTDYAVKRFYRAIAEPLPLGER